jgi:hypothetical protein
MLKINELNSYLKSKGVPEDSYSINEVNDESLCIIEENKKWHIFYSERGLRTEEYCYQDEHLAILYFINRLSEMLKISFEWKKVNRQQTHYFHCDQIGILREMTDIHDNLLWYGKYIA